MIFPNKCPFCLDTPSLGEFIGCGGVLECTYSVSVYFPGRLPASGFYAPYGSTELMKSHFLREGHPNRLPIPQELIHSFICKHFLSTHYGLASGLGLGGVPGPMGETDNCIGNCNSRAVTAWKDKEGSTVAACRRWLAQLVVWWS